MSYRKSPGSTDQSIDVFIPDGSATDGTGLTGLVFNSSGLTCKYRRGATGVYSTLSLAEQTVTGAHSDGGFVEIGNGLYRLDLSDAIVADGVEEVTLILYGATNMPPVPVRIELREDVEDYQPLQPTTPGRTLTVEADGVGHADIKEWLGAAPLSLSSQRVQVSVGAMGTGVITASSIAASALNGKGDWNIGKTGYSLSTSPPTAAAIADQVWTETLADHSGSSGSTAEALNAAGSAGDPWTTPLPGSYSSGQAGYIIGNQIDAAISSRMATFTLPSNFSLLGINGSGHIERVSLVDTTTTNSDMRGTDGANQTTPPTANSIRDAVLDRVLSGNHDTAGTVGELLQTMDMLLDAMFHGWGTISSITDDDTFVLTGANIPTTSAAIKGTQMVVIRHDNPLIRQTRRVTDWDDNTSTVSLLSEGSIAQVGNYVFFPSQLVFSGTDNTKQILRTDVSGYVGINMADVGNPTATVNLSGTTVKAVTDQVTADTTALNGNTNAAAQLARSAATIVNGAAEAGTLSTTQMTTDLSEATDDHYNGCVLIWTSGALANQRTDVTDYAGSNGLLTFTAVTEAPQAGDTFILV